MKDARVSNFVTSYNYILQLFIKLKDGHAINATYDNAFELRRGYFIKN